MKTIIIGNGPSVIQRPRGRIIDSFDRVIRINDYVLDGYEESLGTITDIWAMDSKVFSWNKKYTDRYKNIPEIWVLPSVYYKGRRGKINDELSYLHDNYKVASFVQAGLVTKDVGCFCSTGMFVIWFALKQEFEEPITIYGFDHFKGDRYEYWNTQPSGFKCVHPGAAEEKYVEGLIKKGRLKRL